MINPLGSLQKKHRRSPNKTRLLAAIDKHKAHKFDSGLDAFGTRVFLVSQWVFEALSPPKYTKKPMLFTVLFPLVLILLFGFMAGEYPYWLATNGEAIDDYKFGPEEISSWLFRTESWRVFDDAFLITWGGRSVNSLKLRSELCAAGTCLWLKLRGGDGFSRCSFMSILRTLEGICFSLLCCPGHWSPSTACRELG